MTLRGRFITLEGGEGAGKTTLMQALSLHLNKREIPILRTREPGGTKLGEAVRHLLLHYEAPVSPFAELSLFLASRAQHVAELIEPALQSGKWVICDRFHDSTIAYQGGARGLGMEKVAEFCYFVSGGLKPDLTLYLDIDPKIGLSRAKKERAQDRIESEKLAFHEKIRQSFLKIHAQDPKRFHLLDASLSLDVVAKKAIAIIDAL